MCEPRPKTQLNIIELLGKESKKQARVAHYAIKAAFRGETQKEISKNGNRKRK